MHEHTMERSDVLSILNAIPGAHLILLPDAPRFTIVGATDAYQEATYINRKVAIGQGMFESFTDNPHNPTATGVKNLSASLHHVLEQKQAQHMADQRYDILNPESGQFEFRVWRPMNKPVLDEEGNVQYIIHTVEDITEKMLLQEAEQTATMRWKESEDLLHRMIDQAPMAILLTRGEDVVIESVNTVMLQFMNKTSKEEVLGKKMLEALPELEGQPALQTVIDVQKTGKPWMGSEVPVDLFIEGKLSPRYFNFSYTPVMQDGTPTAVMHVAVDVTEQVLYRKQIEESEQKYRSLFQSMDQGCCLIEMIFDESSNPVDYRFLEINAVFEQQTGLQNALGRTARELIPNLEAHWFKSYGEVALTGEPIRFEEGSEAMNRWFDVFAYRFGGEESRKVMLLFRDITEHKKAEAALKLSAQNLRDTIMQAPIAMGIFRGVQLVVEVANDSMCEVWGKKAEEVMLRPLFDAVPEGKNQGYEELMATVMRTGVPFSARELTVRLPRGGVMQEVFVNFSYTPLREGDGQVTGILVVLIDVTEQVLTRKKIEESKAELQRRVVEKTADLDSQKAFIQSILDASLDGIYALKAVRNTDGVIVDFTYLFANDQIARMLHREVHEIIGSSMLQLLPENRNNGFFDLFCQLLQTGETRRDETHFMAQGIDNWFDYVIVPIDKETLVVSIEDITEKKHAVQQIEEQRNLLERSVEELKRSNANLEEFAYAASHDLKEPARKVSFFADRLKQQLQEQMTEEQNRLFTRMQLASQRMGLLIDDLLTYSHVSKGVSHIELVDLHEKVQLVREDLELEIQEKGATITVDHLPTITGHRRQLQQLFQNLVANALKYSKPGVRPEIQITTRQVRGQQTPLDLSGEAANKCYHLIEVHDNGIGFAQDDAERIFNVFTRLHGNEEYKGSGVGLAIARKVVENHHGYIWAESRPGEGATFNVLLPAE